jgi:hypothetical protein
MAAGCLQSYDNCWRRLRTLAVGTLAAEQSERVEDWAWSRFNSLDDASIGRRPAKTF